jgi:hypothetical protein
VPDEAVIDQFGTDERPADEEGNGGENAADPEPFGVGADALGDCRHTLKPGSGRVEDSGPERRCRD